MQQWIGAGWEWRREDCFDDHLKYWKLSLINCDSRLRMKLSPLTFPKASWINAAMPHVYLSFLVSSSDVSPDPILWRDPGFVPFLVDKAKGHWSKQKYIKTIICQRLYLCGCLESTRKGRNLQAGTLRVTIQISPEVHEVSALQEKRKKDNLNFDCCRMCVFDGPNGPLEWRAVVLALRT